MSLRTFAHHVVGTGSMLPALLEALGLPSALILYAKSVLSLAFARLSFILEVLPSSISSGTASLKSRWCLKTALF